MVRFLRRIWLLPRSAKRRRKARRNKELRRAFSFGQNGKGSCAVFSVRRRRLPRAVPAQQNAAMRKPWFRKQNKAWYFTNDDRSVVFLGHDLRGVRIMQREQLTSICCSSSAIANDDRNCIDIYLYRR